MTVSYINLMRAQQKPHSVVAHDRTFASVEEMRASGRAVRERLLSLQPSAPAPVVRRISAQRAVPVRRPGPAVRPAKPVPLNMLTPCNWNFLLALASLRSRISARTIVGKSRSKRVVAARYEAMRLIFQHTQCSLPMLGRFMRRDHTTVLHALQKAGITQKLVDLTPVAQARSRPKVVPALSRDVIKIAPSPGFRDRESPGAAQIIAETCERHGVSEAEMFSLRRAPKLLAARHEAIWRLVNETVLSTAEIGRITGGRDHTTVMYSARAHEARLRGEKVVWGRAR